MMYDPHHFDKWTATPRETPAWLKQAKYGQCAKIVKLKGREQKERYLLDPYGWLLAGALILFAIYEFTCTLAKGM